MSAGPASLSRLAAGLAIMLALLPLSAAAQGAAPSPAEPLTPPEAVGHLLFSPATVAMAKTLSPGRATWRGATFPTDPEGKILSISASRAAPCLFDAFFVEAPAPAGDPKVAVTTAYIATIDLRKLDRATFHPTPGPAGGAQLVLAAREMFCSRSIILEQTPKLTYNESCLDAIEEAVEPEQTPRLRAAFEALRLACRW